jgi:hypothetical protein
MAITQAYIGKAQYDFDIDGGGVGVITPASNFNLPIGAMIIGTWTDIKTTLASGGSATIAIATAGVAVKAATAFDDNAYVGRDTQTARTAIGTTAAAGAVTFTVATAALTAGKVDIYVEYILAA